MLSRMLSWFRSGVLLHEDMGCPTDEGARGRRGFAHESPSFERSLRSAAVAEQRSRCAHVHCMSWRNDCLREAHALSGPRRTLTLAEWSSILEAML